MKIRIISLGEIVTPNLGNGLRALADMVAAKQASEWKQTLPQVQSTVQKNNDAIEKFKQGLLTEEAFNKLFIETLNKETGVLFTAAEFDSAWDTMNPNYAHFKDNLKTAIDFHAKDDQQLVLISYTNPKDIRHLIKELTINHIDHALDSDGHLCEIAGIKLHTTYTHKTSKADLLKKIIIALRQSNPHRSTLFSESKDGSEMDIKYVHGVNQIQFEVLRKDFDATASSVQAVAEKFQVDSILWNKQAKSLEDILKDEKPVHGLLLASML